MLRFKSVWTIRFLGFIAFVGVGALASGCERGEAEPHAGKASTGDPISTIVEAKTVGSAQYARRIPVVGTLFAAEEAVISTRTAGILRRTFVDVGATVKPDDPLAQVDTLDYEVAVEQSQAALAEVLARLGVQDVPDKSFDLTGVSTVERAAAHLENARFSNQRLQDLNRGEVAGVAEQEMNDATTRLRVAASEYRSALDEAAAMVAAARERQALLQMTQQRLINALTKTPPIPSTLGKDGALSWTVATRLVTEGQYLNVADDLFHLIISDPLKLRSKVPERYAAQVAVDQTIDLEIMGAGSATGRILRINPAVDPASRTFEIEALIDNEGNTLKPGVFATGVLLSVSEIPIIRVPAEAVVTTGGIARIFVLDNGIARQRTVEIGEQMEGQIEIVSGLHDGEVIVTKGAGSLMDGVAVQVLPGS